ncbi:branched-chain amino acid ABC transporter ATP-binding protein/permease [Paenibacillus sp. N4]|uniref:branched-chain amino acid ABC transporter ATP-binding protein/permease n=1 Tax=Paenibacillus vietnamensis TaxID=2590547 RepID=UPI001CD06F5F|nr:branched-chain amino acid ABC transporter ATP-binding protein/permease [Paenibacillus vietnamensis]MCA0756227.1 branched-chain amino acid ABC transporter ATP-binding protein/permease [Paenibacillus vietnamensis]
MNSFLQKSSGYRGLAASVAAAAAVALLAAGPWLVDTYYLNLMFMIGIFVITCTGMNLLIGYCGIVSIGHAGLMAVGAYMSSFLSTKYGMSFWTVALIGMAVSLVIGSLIAIPTIRAGGVYLSMITIAFGVVIHEVLIRWDSFTGGPLGISGIPKPQACAYTFDLKSMYLLVLVISVAALLLVRNLRRSAWGRAMIATKENEIAAASLGIRKFAAQYAGFAVSSVLAGLSGALYAHTNSFISPDTYHFQTSVQLVLIVILGGAGRVLGPVVGATIIVFLPELLEMEKLRMALYGAIMFAVLYFLPKGIVGTVGDFLRSKFGKSVTAAGSGPFSETAASAVSSESGSFSEAAASTVSSGFGLPVLAAASAGAGATTADFTGTALPVHAAASAGAGATTAAFSGTVLSVSAAASVGSGSEHTALISVVATALPAVSAVSAPRKESMPEREPVASAASESLDAANLLVLEGINKHFGGLHALKDVSMAVASGSIHSLVGPNGAGKTTLLNVISGLYGADQGTFELHGKPFIPRSLSSVSVRGIARTFQHSRLFKELSVLENVMTGMTRRHRCGFAQSLLRMPKQRRAERVMEERARDLLDFIGYVGDRHMPASQLPYGHQRMVEIARALATAPSLLLLDEPAAGMTAAEIGQLEQLLRKLAQNGLTIVLIEHHMDFVQRVSDTVTVLDFGRVIGTGRPEQMLNDPRVIQAYLGAEEVAASAER